MNFSNFFRINSLETTAPKTTQLVYRGQPYERNCESDLASNSLQSSTDKPIKLIYRGQTYDYIPKNVPVFYLNSMASTNRFKLIYRGQIFDYTPLPQVPYRKPQALNWRFQIPSE